MEILFYRTVMQFGKDGVTIYAQNIDKNVFYDYSYHPLE